MGLDHDLLCRRYSRLDGTAPISDCCGTFPDGTPRVSGRKQTQHTSSAGYLTGSTVWNMW